MPLDIHVTVVEPAYFHTDFPDSSSLSVSDEKIAEYADTVDVIRPAAAGLNHSQPGDPAAWLSKNCPASCRRPPRSWFASMKVHSGTKRDVAIKG